jgi:catechol 1,2-dioxygenase
MSSAKARDGRTPRLNELFDDLSATLKDFIREHHVTYEEYHRALAFLTETGDKGEIPLLFDVFLEVTVDDVDHRGRPGTETTVEGPYYVAGAPELRSPCVLPHRANEPGDILIFSGTVRGTDGAALGGAVVDFWQADAEGRYSHFNIDEDEAPFNLRAKVIADDRGHFEMQTRVPAAYEIPKAGPTGMLIKALGGHPWRPAHVHVRITRPGCAPLTTQVFLKDDPWIDSDVVGAVKQSLIMGMTRHDEAAEIKRRGLAQPFYTLNYDFVLPRDLAKAA